MVYKNIFLIQESSPNRCWNDRRGSRDVLHHYLTPHISITALVVVVETVVQGQVVVPSVVVGVFSSLTLSWFLEDDEDDENSQAKEADEYRGDVLQREAVRSDAIAKLEMESFTFVCVQELMDGRMDVWISGWMDAYGVMDGCANGWMDVWVRWIDNHGHFTRMQSMMAQMNPRMSVMMESMVRVLYCFWNWFLKKIDKLSY